MTAQFRPIYQQEEDQPKKLLDAWEVATILRISRSTVHQLVKEGRLACVQVTKRTRRFTKEMVKEFIKSETVRRNPCRVEDFLEAARIMRA